MKPDGKLINTERGWLLEGLAVMKAIVDLDKSISEEGVAPFIHQEFMVELLDQVPGLIGFGLEPINLGIPENKVSNPYDTFESDGTYFESRIVRIPICNAHSLGNIYLVAVMGRNDVVFNADNCLAGAVDFGGRIELFSLEVEKVSDESEEYYLYIIKEGLQGRSLHVDIISNLELRSEVIREFQKAVAVNPNEPLHFWEDEPLPYYEPVPMDDIPEEHYEEVTEVIFPDRDLHYICSGA